MRFFTDEKLAAAPAAQSTRLIDFEYAQVNGGFINDTYFLTVQGEKPYLNMEVVLSPMIYVQRPEYWEIEVVGILPGFGLPAFAPYSKTLPLEGFLGTKGIEVVGANKRQRFDILEDVFELCNEDGKVRYRANQVPGGVIIFAEGAHPTSGFETFFTSSLLDIFPPQFILNHRKSGDSTLDVITPFEKFVTFETSEKIETVTVHDARGAHEIDVDQTPD